MKKISQLPGGHALTGTEMVPVVQDAQTRQVPASYFAGAGGSSEVSFPAHSSLSTADIGKLVMNEGGSVRVAQKSAPTSGQAGKWKLLVQAPIAPQQAEFTFKFLDGESVVDGHMFSLWGNTFTFKNTATEPYDIQIGANDIETASNIASTFISTGIGNDYLLIGNESIDTGRVYTLRAGANFPGLSGDNLSFSSTTDAFSVSTQPVPGKNNDLDKVADAVFTLHRNSDGYDYLHTVTLGHILHASTSAYGTKLGDYRWPATTAYMLGNLHLYLESNTAFNTHFSHFWNIDLIFEINESASPEPAGHDDVSITAALASPVSVSIVSIQDSVSPVLGFVIHPVLGVLKSLHAGTAKLDSGRMFKVRLASASDPVVFDPTFPVNLEARMMTPTNNGEVLRELIETSDNNYFANGIFLALEEAAPGDELLVEWVKILGH